MKKERPPLEENVDIELEYKLLYFYDKVKPYLKFILAGAVVLVLVVIFFIYKKEKDTQILNKASVKVYQILNLIENEKYDKAYKEIENFKSTFSNTPYIKLVNALKIKIDKIKDKSIDEKILTDTKNMFSSEQLKAFYTEFEGYLKFKNKNYNISLEKLNQVKQNHFNYLSAKLLEGIIYKAKKEDKKARIIFDEIKELSKDKYPYFYSITND